MAKRKSRPPEFTVVRISKGNGKFRTIYKPRKDIKLKLQQYVADLEAIALKACPPNVVHGFWPARSCVSNAAMHIGYRFTLCMDLKDFFDHCTATMLHEAASHGGPGIPTDMRITPDNACRQGLPTSPAAANICASKMDWKLYEYCSKAGVVYTRYADDLAFSTNNWENVLELMHFVPRIANEHGFQVNAKKTHTFAANAGRRVVTGVAVDDTGVYPTRKAKRKLRAAKHKAAMKPHNPHWKHAAAGLAEWVKCKKPGIGRKARKLIEKAPDDALQIAAKASGYGVNL
jgi:hypothetical protein